MCWRRCPTVANFSLHRRLHESFRSHGITSACEAFAQSGSAEAHLTRREIEILRLVGEGLSSKEIATRLGLSLRSIESHRTHLFQKLKLRSAVELVRYAVREGLIGDLSLAWRPPLRRCRGGGAISSAYLIERALHAHTRPIERVRVDHRRRHIFYPVR